MNERLVETSGNGAPPSEPFVRQVRIRNFKSIAICDVELKRLTVLAGRNGSGKSNFLDALRFVVDGLQASLVHALKSRGGIDDVRRRSTGHPRNFSIELTINLDRQIATYGFEIAGRAGGGFVVKRERLKILDMNNRPVAHYRVEDATLADASQKSMPPTASDRLYLVNAAGLPEFRGVYDALLTMGFYNLNPQAMKEFQSPDAGELLHRDGANIASVIGRIEAEKPEVKKRIQTYLASIVPGISDFSRITHGPRETLQFRQKVVGSENPWKFYANSMSDGTLRALGILVAVMQLADRQNPVRLVGIEEPETALHAAAAGALVESLREAALHTQVVITSHSPDILDQIDIENDQLLACAASEGNTKVGQIDRASREALHLHLFQAGELLRMDQLEPDTKDIARQEQMDLFGEKP